MATYQKTWRNKWLTANANSIEDMIDALQRAVDELRAMKAAGVVLKEDCSVKDDYALLVTEDRAVAERFEFEEEEEDDEDESE
jgi:hypothetical protein